MLVTLTVSFLPRRLGDFQILYFENIKLLHTHKKSQSKYMHF